MYARLTVMGGPNDGLEIAVSRFPMTLGREGDARLPLGDRWASRHHCQLFTVEGQLMLRDLASKHGTFVNGDRTEQADLENGDRIMIGLTQVVVSDICLDFHVEQRQEKPADRPSNGGAPVVAQ